MIEPMAIAGVFPSGGASSAPARLGPGDIVASRVSDATYPVTPDGRYFVVRGRLWRRADPSLAEARRASLVAALMRARRAVGVALRQDDRAALAAARAEVDRAKTALGERGPVWWQDGAPDLNRHLAANTVYANWFAQLEPTR